LPPPRFFRSASPVTPSRKKLLRQPLRRLPRTIITTIIITTITTPTIITTTITRLRRLKRLLHRRNKHDLQRGLRVWSSREMFGSPNKPLSGEPFSLSG
jgi:hypothetical protein